MNISENKVTELIKNKVTEPTNNADAKNIGLEELEIFTEKSNKLLEKIRSIVHPYRKELEKAVENAINKKTIKYIDDAVNAIETYTVIDDHGEITSTYARFKEYLKSKGWSCKNSHINERNTRIVAQHSNGLYVQCPSGYMMTIHGTCDLPDDCLSQAYVLELMIKDIEGNEIEDDTEIRISKRQNFEEVTDICTVSYGDVSPRLGSRWRKYKEKYRFLQNIYVDGGSRLCFDILPTVRIFRPLDIKLKLMVDLWNKVDKVD